jgi:DNA-directed RNA polymerase specialized sigma24 family protein
MGSRRDQNREILLFDSETLADLAVEAEQCDGPHSCGNERLDALEQCLAKLPAPQKEAIEKRYYEGEDILEMTRSLHRTESAVKMLLLRARASLLECVNRILQPTSIP